jgi:hypothetical protein
MTRGGSMWVAALGAVCVLAGSWSAQAQFQPRARPRHGFAQLEAGFVPDPHIMTGVMGGNVVASQFGPNCRGSIFAAPSHVIRTRSGFRNIRFVVSAQADSTLMVMLPNGQILCDDDGGGSLNPLVQAPSPPGEIRVWVGVYSESAQNQPYTIGFTEHQHITHQNLTSGGRPPPPGYPQPQPPPVAGVNPNAPPAYGTVQLRAGFAPDPNVVAGHAGGNIQASTVDANCRGWVTAQPNHVIMSQTGFRNLRFAVNSAVDTTLMVMLPNGQISCDDDGGDSGMNPLVSVSSPPGAIRVWIGTYSQGQTGPYNIGFTQHAHIDTSSIPPPGGGPIVRPQPQYPQPQPQPVGEQVQMTVGIPVTLVGPGMDGNTIAVWTPTGSAGIPVAVQARAVVVGGVSITQIPPAMTDPIVTVVQLRNGGLVVRAEQPPAGRGDRGQALVLLVRNEGRPTVAQQWAGTAVQRAPRWSR